MVLPKKMKAIHFRLIKRRLCPLFYIHYVIVIYVTAPPNHRIFLAPCQARAFVMIITIRCEILYKLIIYGFWKAAKPVLVCHTTYVVYILVRHTRHLVCCSAALLPMLGAGSCTSELDLQLKIFLFWKYVGRYSKLLEKVLEKFMNTHVIHF